MYFMTCESCASRKSHFKCVSYVPLTTRNLCRCDQGRLPGPGRKEDQAYLDVWLVAEQSCIVHVRDSGVCIGRVAVHVHGIGPYVVVDMYSVHAYVIGSNAPWESEVGLRSRLRAGVQAGIVVCLVLSLFDLETISNMASQSARKTERDSRVDQRRAPAPDAAWEERRSKHSRRQALADKTGVLSITPMKAYLLFYNILSCALWIQIFLLTVAYITTPHSAPISAKAQTSVFGPILRFFGQNASANATGFGLSSSTPKFVQDAIHQLRGSYHFMGLGTWVKVTQTLAVMDVVHAATGVVKSNVGTAASQVFSRLWAVWAVVEMVPEVGSSLCHSVTGLGLRI
jgi:hypothetical protein